MPQIRYTAQARQDLIELWLTIAADNPQAADAVLERLALRATMLADHPFAGRARPELSPEARMTVDAPYVLLYRPIDTGIQIVLV
ncbi:type II toxin-antitoxin system RelE/ParE family toxin [Acidisoma cellulosilytica]|uniref:Type II toxin-antitoxin system RelE/ParE family toxin n=1 Tax=Acidisoma cellulosilyticum TaxID=2802395 RepID=A0A963YZA9_9PROT|nr:type II toxin-antitoxin system RelE/ParE family toxin [Acidisoma cellulosilyticum]MCB8879686.1 type II toxin-antitoxin system RelE/ParE family toxin [Acidisoma cellulosilyticum]